MLSILCGTFLLSCLIPYSSCSKTPIYILGLYPMTGDTWPGGVSLYPASQLAVEHVNNNPDILQDYQLRIALADTQCDGGHSVNSMFRELYNMSTTKVFVLGCGCSLSTIPTAAASHLWNLIQLSYSAFSPELSQKSVYPLFFRLIVPGTTFNLIRIAFLKYFGWKRVATLSLPGATFEVTIADFRVKAEETGIQVVVSETFTDDPTFQLINIKKQGVRIIYFSTYEPDARKIFCRAYHEGMYGSKYVWIIEGFYQRDWWKIRDENSMNCTVEEMRKATEGYFSIHVDALPEGDETKRVSGLSSHEYEVEYNEYVNYKANELLGIEEAPYGYDSIWTIALALHEADRILKEKRKW
ncbi:gamma-aminobutyric acid type B receptor subunit 1-like [Amphiura filiformis]|uniref:gamma-aminobutyric acid type B receptor subunit 1-like n=1 Tax=Amphiura filiformis TaxID=82378 RepID=UPI003B21A553